MARTARSKAQAGREARPARQRARPAPHTDPDRLNRMLIMGGIVAVILFAIGIIGFGWYQTQIRPLGKTVLQVGEIEFSLGHLERRMRLEMQDNPFYQGQTVLQLPDVVMERLEREAKLLQGAGELNITATDEDVSAEVRETGRLADDVEASVFAAEFRRQVKESHLREGEYRQLLRARILEQRVRDYFLFLAPKTEEQALARWIVVDDEDVANAALLRLAAGEDFSELANELSLDPQRAEVDRENGWTLRGSLDEGVEEFMFEAEPGTISEVLAVGTSFFIMELVEREADRDLTDQQRQSVATREMDEWLESLDSKYPVQEKLSDEDAVRALDDVL